MTQAESETEAAKMDNDTQQDSSEASSSPSTSRATSPSGDNASSSATTIDHSNTTTGSGVKAVVSNVTTTTKKLMDTSAEKTKSIVQDTKNKTMDAVETSKATIETNPWLLPLKWCLHFPRHWPRVNAIFLVVVLLWLLILISMGFGVLLARAESPEEVRGNDVILEARAQIEWYRISDASLLNITQQCLNQWEQDDGLFTNPDGDDFAEVNRSRLEESLKDCASSYFPEIREFEEASNNNSATASQSLSFNWNRCWPLTGQRQLIFYPSQEMIDEAHPDAQAAYFEQEWNKIQKELYEEYLPANATEEERAEAYFKSIADATGDSACEENMGGTAWFFFTIITTVGYGNQAPVTEDGRVIVVAAGLMGLILFGAVLGLTGYVTVSIFDDAVGRTPFKCILRNPLFGMIFWGGIWMLYALALSQDFYWWWTNRLPEFAATIDQADTLWFAFISTSTIGLGDYYLQPEIIFASDTLKYSVLFLVGFVFLSSFFGKIAACLSVLLPSQHNSLEYRLKKTRVLACWRWGWMPWETKKNEDEDQEEDDEYASGGPDDEALLYRIDQLKQLKPDPPEGSERRGLVSTLTGNSILSMNLELLQKEEALLREWLAVVRLQERRAIAARRAANAKLSRTSRDTEEGGSEVSREDNDDDDEAVLNSVFDKQAASTEIDA